MKIKLNTHVAKKQSLIKLFYLSFVTLLTVMSLPVLSNVNESAIHNAAVRVEANGNFASGFIYGNEYEVVTSLHAILPPPQVIEIYCKGTPVKADVVTYLQSADLVLLKARTSLKNFGCEPYPQLKQNVARPNLGTELVTFSFRDDNRQSAFPHFIKKGSSGSPETLSTLLGDTASVNARRHYPDIMPNLDLPLYHVAGPLFPGTSGSPTFISSTGELVGIVAGGLDNGVRNHAWLVPISNLNQLMKTDKNSVLPNINPSKFGYSSASSTRTKENTVEYSDPDASYMWVKLKSRSFKQLVETANDREGLNELMEEIFPEIEDPASVRLVSSIRDALQFDIYEESEHGLIVAVPMGATLEVKKYDDGYHYLYVGNENLDASFIVDFGSHKILSVEDENDQMVLPSEDRYFENALSNWMFNYCEGAEPACYYDDTSAKVVDFGSTRKLLRFVYYTDKFYDEVFEERDYSSISILVNGNKIMEVESSTIVDQNSALMKCISDPNINTCGKPYWVQFSYMLASRLSSFTNLGSDNSDTKKYSLQFDCTFCAVEEDSESANNEQDVEQQENLNQPAANFSVNYSMPNGEPLFYLDESNQWWVADTQTKQWFKLSFIQQEQWNDQQYIHLRYEQSFSYLVPYEGGVWFTWSNVNGQDQWTESGTVQANVKFGE